METSGRLWQYNRDEPALNNTGDIIDFLDNDNSVLFKFKEKLTGQTKNHGTKDVEIVVPLKLGSHLPKEFVLFTSMKALYEWWKNYFISKAIIFHLKIFKYLSSFFSHAQR